MQHVGTSEELHHDCAMRAAALLPQKERRVERWRCHHVSVRLIAVADADLAAARSGLREASCLSEAAPAPSAGSRLGTPEGGMASLPAGQHPSFGGNPRRRRERTCLPPAVAAPGHGCPSLVGLMEAKAPHSPQWMTPLQKVTLCVK